MDLFVTQPFIAAYGAQADYFEGMQSKIPDAGLRLKRLQERLSRHTLPLLQNQPGLGRPSTIPKTGETVQMKADIGTLMAIAVPEIARAQASLREYVDKDFNVLYAVTTDAVFIISLKNQRRLRYLLH